MENVQQRVAVVTGGSRGIGLAVASLLAQRGVHVVTGAQNEAEGQAALEPVRASGFSASCYALDVSSEASVEAFAQRVREECGRLDILVNNAGVALDKRAPALEISLETFRRTLDVNVLGAVRMLHALMPLMLDAGFGRVVNVSSVLGSLSNMRRHAMAYRASKAALNAITRVLAAEYEEEDILINSVCPGWVRTEIGGDEAPRTPESAADGVVWLATLPRGGPSGGFFRDREPLPW